MAPQPQPKIPLERQHATNLRRISDLHSLVPKSVGEHLDKSRGEVERLVHDLELGAIAKGLERHLREVDHEGKVAPTERDLRLSKISTIMAQVAHKAYQAGKAGEERQ